MVAFLALSANRLPNAALIGCQAKLANKNTVFDTFQSFRQSVCLHPGRSHEFQQNMPLRHLLVDLFIADVDVFRAGRLEGVEYGQPNVLAVRMDE